MNANIKTIRFVDSKNKELFRIPDGGNIKITYSPEDGREPVTVPCKFMGAMRVRIDICDFHIREFARRMERIGARYEPA